MSTLEPAAAGVLLVAGAAWGLAAGAGRPHRAHAAASALAGPMLATLMVPPAAMLASLAGLLGEGTRPVPLGLAVAACVVVGGAMSALALASASLSGLAFGGGAYLAVWLVLGPTLDDGMLQPLATFGGAMGVWASLGFGGHRLPPVWLAATLGPAVVAQAVVAASRIAGPSVLAPDVGGQAISAGGGATAAAGIYLLREAVRRRSRKLPRSAARAPQ